MTLLEVAIKLSELAGLEDWAWDDQASHDYGECLAYLSDYKEEDKNVQQ